MQRVAVWCSGFWVEGRPFFFENAVGKTITINGAYYRDSIIRFFVSKLQDVDGKTMPYEKRFDYRIHFLSFLVLVIKIVRLKYDLTPLHFFLFPSLRFLPTIHVSKEETERCVNEIHPIYAKRSRKISTKAPTKLWRPFIHLRYSL